MSPPIVERSTKPCEMPSASLVLSVFILATLACLVCEVSAQVAEPFEVEVGVEDFPVSSGCDFPPPISFEQFRPAFRPLRSSVTAGWLDAGGSQGLGVMELDLSTTFAAPCPWLDQAQFSVTPSFGFRSLDAPAGIDLPSELFQGSVMFTLTKTFSENLQATVGLAPGYFGDGDGGGSEAFRLLAMGNVAWRTSPTTKWLFGVVVTGRDDIPVLPLLGLVWTPSPDWQVELTAPRPRVSYRLKEGYGYHDQWVYLAGEFGGGTWAVDRNGRDDELTLRDFRMVLGWEAKGPGLINPKAEVGYVFGREAEYESDGWKYKPSDTLMIRVGVAF